MARSDAALREGLVQALLICQTEAEINDARAGEVARSLCGEILERWDELMLAERRPEDGHDPSKRFPEDVPR